MKRRPTMADVARTAGVSPMTVSRALRGDPTASAATRERVATIAEELGYVIDGTAVAFSSRKSGFVGVTIPSLNNANFADTLRGLTERVEAANLQILLGYTDYDIEHEERVVAALLRRHPQAMVVTGGAHTARTRRYLERAAVPVVEMWDQPEAPIDHVVGFSNADAAALMVRHLHARGHREMGFLGIASPRDTRGGDRLRGFRHALTALGLATHRLVQVGQPPVDMAQGADAMERMLDRWPEVDAVLCVSDLAAMGALCTCHRRGVRVPGDVAVAGFGNFDLAAYTVPSLTTVDVDTTGIGRRVGDVVVEAVAAGDERIAARRLSTAIRTIVRESA